MLLHISLVVMGMSQSAADMGDFNQWRRINCKNFKHGKEPHQHSYHQAIDCFLSIFGYHGRPLLKATRILARPSHSSWTWGIIYIQAILYIARYYNQGPGASVSSCRVQTINLSRVLCCFLFSSHNPITLELRCSKQSALIDSCWWCSYLIAAGPLPAASVSLPASTNNKRSRRRLM